MVSFTKLLFAGLAAVASAQTTIHPPGGNGLITVQLDGQLSPSGCLDINGLWTKNTASCVTYAADGVGDITGPNGKCLLNAVGTLHCISSGVSTAWVGDYLNGNKSAMYLVANSGATKPPYGGPIFYAFAQPTGTGTQLLTGNSTVGASVKVYMSWIQK